MKKILMGLCSTAMLFTAGVAMAEGDAAAPAAAAPAAHTEADCQLDAINAKIDEAITAVKASPAYGEAKGHYGKAEKDLLKTKKQLEEGCKAWVKGGEKAKKKATK